jgi:hypothetical protein
MNRKMLVVLSYWESDRQHAGDLARYLVDLEPAHSKSADFLVVNRFDCKRDPQIVTALSRKFNVFQHTSQRRETGWPQGCNGLFFGSMEWVWSMKQARRLADYKCIFNCESDGAPLVPDWIDRLRAEWDVVNKNGPVVLAGPLVEHPREHINANALLSCDLKFLTWLTRRVSTVRSGGWDYALAPLFKKMGWANILCMRSLWGTQHFVEREYAALQASGAVWVHGDKSGDLLRIGWSRMKASYDI